MGRRSNKRSSDKDPTWTPNPTKNVKKKRNKSKNKNVAEAPPDTGGGDVDEVFQTPSNLSPKGGRVHSQETLPQPQLDEEDKRKSREPEFVTKAIEEVDVSSTEEVFSDTRQHVDQSVKKEEDSSTSASQVRTPSITNQSIVTRLSTSSSTATCEQIYITIVQPALSNNVATEVCTAKEEVDHWYRQFSRKMEDVIQAVMKTFGEKSLKYKELVAKKDRRMRKRNQYISQLNQHLGKLIEEVDSQSVITKSNVNNNDDLLDFGPSPTTVGDPANEVTHEDVPKVGMSPDKILKKPTNVSTTLPKRFLSPPRKNRNLANNNEETSKNISSPSPKRPPTAKKDEANIVINTTSPKGIRTFSSSVQVNEEFKLKSAHLREIFSDYIHQNSDQIESDEQEIRDLHQDLRETIDRQTETIIEQRVQIEELNRTIEELRRRRTTDEEVTSLQQRLKNLNASYTTLNQRYDESAERNESLIESHRLLTKDNKQLLDQLEDMRESEEISKLRLDEVHDKLKESEAKAEGHRQSAEDARDQLREIRSRLHTVETLEEEVKHLREEVETSHREITALKKKCEELEKGRSLPQQKDQTFRNKELSPYERHKLQTD